MTITNSFRVQSPLRTATLQLWNYGVASAVISVNGQVVLGPSDFSAGQPDGTLIERPLSLPVGTNSLSVELRSKPGTSVQLDVVGAYAPIVSDLQPAQLTLAADGGNGLLTVTVQQPDSVSPMDVALSSGDSTVAAVPSDVMVAAGTTTATFLVTAGNPGGPIVITARLNGTSATSQVIVRVRPAPPVLTQPLAEGAMIVAGTGVANALVDVFVDGTITGSGSIGSDSTFSVSVPTLRAGQSVTATQSLSGVTSLPSSAVIVQVRPPAPTVTPPLIDGATQVTGTASPAATVTVLVDGATAAMALAAGDGTFTIALGAPLIAGQQVSATQTVAGVTSIPSAAVTVVTVPAPPVVNGPIVAGSSTIGGTGSTGATVEAFVNSVSVGMGVVGAGGAWTIGVSSALVAGQHVNARQTVAGVSSAFSPDVIVAARPAPPTITGPLVDGSMSVAGTGLAGATVGVFVNGSSAGSALVGSDGAWTAELGSPLMVGQSVTAAQTAGGIQSDFTPPLIVEARPPAPVISGPLVDGATTVSGSGTAAAVLQLYVNSAFTASTTVGGSGTWSLTLQTPLIAGQQVIGRQVLAGVVGDFSAPLTVLARPPAPEINSPILAGATTIAGNGSAGASLEAFVDGVSLGATAVANNGTWALPVAFTLSAGQTITAQQTVNAITSPLSAPVVVQVGLVRIDITPSPTATLTQGQVIQFTARGTFSDGSVQDPLTSVTWVSDAASIATIDPTGVLTGVSAGIARITASQGAVDSIVTAVTVKPLAPTVASPLIAGATIVSGTGAEPGGIVQVYVNAVSRGGSIAADTSGNWTVAAFSPTLVANDSVTATEAVNGVISDLSAPVVVGASVLTQVVISPSPTATITQGQTIAFSARGIFSDGTVQDRLAGVVWSSDNPSVATIDAAGVLTGVGAGVAHISASLGTLSATATTVAVKPLPPTISAPIAAGFTSVSGTGAETGASVQVFVNGSPRGTSAVADLSGRWLVSGLTPAFALNDSVTARQTVNGIASDPSTPVVASNSLTVSAGPDQTASLPVLGLPSQYTVTILPTLGGPRGVAFDINDAGDIAGEADDASGHLQPVLWRSGKVIQLPTLGGSTGSAVGVNINGQVAGLSQDATGDWRDFYFDGSQILDVAQAPDCCVVWQMGLNRLGQVAGSETPPLSPFVYQNNTVTPLPTLPGTTSAQPERIGDDGLIVGRDFVGNVAYPVMWKNGQVQQLPGSPGLDGSQAIELNHYDEIVGSLEDTSGHDQAVVWQNGTMTALPGLGIALSINDSHQILANQGNWANPVVWQNGVSTALPAVPSCTSVALVHINNRGEIAGYCTPNFTAVLLTPVPQSFASSQVTLPLSGTVSGNGGPLTLQWTTVSGPGPVTFGDDSQAVTSATFTQAGQYVLRLTATDSQISNSADVAITIGNDNHPPTVNAGSNQNIQLPAAAFLDGSASDDGLPSGKSLSFSWWRLSGPGTVTFSAPNQLSTSATFSMPGTYELRLVANDGALSGAADVTIVVSPPQPTLTLHPNSAAQGQQNVSVSLTGQFTHWSQGATQVTFGPDITVNSVTVTDNANLTAIVTIPPGAIVGPHTVSVTTGTEIASLPNGFTVTGPTLTAINITPAGAAAVTKGQTLAFAALGVFSDGSTQSSLPGVTWSSDSSSASINGAGVATGITAGTASIRASLGTIVSPATALMVKPTPPSITPPVDTGSHVMIGVADANAIVQVYVNGVARPGAATSDAAGAWSACVIPSPNTGDAVTARQTVNGVESDPSTALIASPPVQPQALAVSDSTAPLQQFGRLDITTGTFTPIGNPSTPLQGIAVGPGCVLYGASGTGNVYRVDPATANLTLLGANAIGFNNFTSTSDGRLWAVDVHGNLDRIDPVSGTATLVGPTVSLGLSQSGLAGGADALFFNFAHSPFSPGDSTLYSLDLNTGAPTVIGPSGLANRNAGIALGEIGGVIYDDITPVYAGNTVHELYQLDPTSGRATFVTGIDLTVLQDINQLAEIPVHVPMGMTITTAGVLPASVAVSSPATVTITVRDGDLGATPTPPTGVVAVTSSDPDDGTYSCSLTALSTFSASCNVTVVPNSAGTRTLTVSYPGDGIRLASQNTLTLAVTGLPGIVSVQPAGGAVGQLNLNVTVRGQSTHWSQATTQVSFGPDIVVNSVVVSNSTQLTASVTIPVGATVGPHMLTVTTGAEVATLANAFAVNAGTPVITAITPSSGEQGQQNLTVTLTGLFTNWVQGTTVASFGSGISVVSLMVTSPGSATAVLSIDAAAPAGPRTVTTTTGAEIENVPGGFQVTGSTCSAPPSGILAWWPAEGNAGSVFGGHGGLVGYDATYVPAQVGQGFSFSGISNGSPGSIVTVPDAPDLSLTTMTLEGWILIRHAPPVSTDWVVATKGISSTSENYGLYVRDVTGAGDLELLFEYYTPSGFVGLVSEGAPLTLNTFHHVAATVDGTAIRLYVDGQFISGGLEPAPLEPNPGPLQIGSAGPAFGNRFNGAIDELSLYNRALTDAEIQAIYAAGGAGKCVTMPYLASATPTSTVPGQNVAIAIVGENTHFASGVTQVSAGPDLSVTGVNVTDATHLLADLTVPAGATVGPHTITATSSTEAVSLLNLFTVAAPPPALISVLPSTGTQGQQNLDVAVIGQSTHFAAGVSTVFFASSAVTVNTVTVTSPTSLTANISIASNASAVPRTVTVTTGGEVVALANAFTVQPAVNQPPVIAITPTWSDALLSQLLLTYTVTDDGLPLGGALTVSWQTISGPGTVGFLNQTPTSISANFAQAGTYVLRITATDTQFTVFQDVTVVVSPATGPPPTVSIMSPADGAEVTGPISVVGTVAGTALASWALEFRLTNEPAFRTIAAGTSPVANGLLGTLDPTLLLNGIGFLQLIATDTAGQTTTAGPVSLVIAQDQKVGNFTVSFTDLSVPVAGLPIQIVRTYDSRNKAVGDFGIGWRLDLNTVTLATNGVLGDGWTGTGGGTFPNYCVEPTRSHLVTVTFADGTLFEFQPTLAPACQELVPLEQSTLVFTPVSTTPPNATLTPLGTNQPFLSGAYPGPITLLDLDDTTTFDPDLYLLTMPDGRKLVISRLRGLQTLSDPNGNTLTVSASGIVHSSGTSVAFQRDAENRITQVTDPAGHILLYGYDGDGNLQTVRDQNNNVTTFSYDTTHDLVSIQDPRGVQPIKNVYDDSGRLIQHVDAFGHTINYTHDLADRQEIVTDRLGNVTVNEYDLNGNIVKVTDAAGGVTTRAYDSRNNLLSETNPLGKTRNYTYDPNDNRLSDTDPLGNTTAYTYNSQNQVLTVTDPQGHVTTNAYDASGNLVSTKDPLGNTTAYTYNASGLRTAMTDALGNTTSYQYDAGGNLTQQTDALGHTTTYTYDADGNRLSESRTQTTATGSRTVTTQYQYDGQNHLTQTTFADGGTTQTAYNTIGKAATTTDQLGRHTAYIYDLMGRLTTTTFPDGTAETSAYDAEGDRTASTDRAGRTTTYTYDALKRLTQTTFADSSSTSTTYDAAGRVTAATDARGNSTQYVYDDAGRRTAVTDALGHTTVSGYDGAGNQISATDANGHVTGYQYDGNNRRIGTLYADGTKDAVAYDALGRTVSKTDQAGLTTQFQYDAVGRLIVVIDALGQRTAYAYDELGNRTSQTDANGHTTQFGYDALGRRTNRTLPVGMIETATYDVAGNVASKTDFNGRTTIYAYDLLNRLTRKTPDPGFGQPAVQFSFGPTGQRSQMVDLSGTTTYTYDVRDRLLIKATPEGTLTYSYDTSGDLTSIQSSNTGGTSVSYTYDALNRLATVTDNRLSAGMTTYAYDNVGNLAGFTAPNRVTHSYSYDTLNRLTALTLAEGSSTSLASYAYTLGPAGNRMAVTELSGRQVAYSYDNLYRLTLETITGAVGSTTTYGYDPVGNRLAKTSPSVDLILSSYDANDRLMTDAYDNNGNTVGSAGNVFSYDFENHLSSENSGAVTILYDGDGNRVAKTVGGVTTSYLVDDRNPTGYAQVVEELSAGSVQRVYTYGLNRISQSQASGVSFYGYDGHGNVRLLTDTTGAITDRYDYDAFGNVISQTGTTPNVYLYSGEQSEPNLGFYYLRARYMNVSSGRFATADPMSAAEGPLSNWYAYASDRPTDLVDPTGLWPTETHDYIIEHALLLAPPVLSLEDISVLEASSESQDDVVSFGQNASNSYQHHMRAWYQSESAARSKYENFLATNLAQANFAESSGLHTLALTLLGKNLHAISDGTSPAHSCLAITTVKECSTVFEGFRPWGGVLGGVVAPFLVARHIAEESSNSDPGINEAITLVHDYYIANFGTPLTRRLTSHVGVSISAESDASVSDLASTLGVVAGLGGGIF